MQLSEQTLAIIVSGLGILAALIGLGTRVLWSHLKDKTQTIEELRQDLTRARADNATNTTRELTLRTERDNAIGEKVTAEARLANGTADRDKAKADAQRYYVAGKAEVEKRLVAEKKAADAEKLVADAKEKETLAVRDAERLRGDLAAARRDLTAAQGRVRELEGKLVSEIGRRERAEKETIDAKGQLFDAVARCSELISQRDVARKRLGELELELIDLKEKLTAAGKRETLLHNELDGERNARKRAEEHAETLEQQVGDLRETNKKLRVDLDRYETQIDSVAKQDGRVWRAPLETAPPRFVPLAERGGRRPVIISMLNLKGGVGKTTLTANLGGYLAHSRKKWVLLLDLDHQRSLTQMMLCTDKRKAAADAGRTIQDFFLSDRSGRELRKVAEQVQGEGYDRCWLVSNSDVEQSVALKPNLDDLEMDLLGRWLLNPTKCDIRYLLRRALHSETVQEAYDYVLIDCPPRLTTACVNALAASDFVLIPTEADPISARSVPHLLRRLRDLQEGGILPELRILGVVANMVSANADESGSLEGRVLRQTEALARNVWSSPVQVLKTKFRDSGYYAACQAEIEERLRLPAVTIDAINKQYGQLTDEIEDHL